MNVNDYQDVDPLVRLRNESIIYYVPGFFQPLDINILEKIFSKILHSLIHRGACESTGANSRRDFENDDRLNELPFCPIVESFKNESQWITGDLLSERITARKRPRRIAVHGVERKWATRGHSHGGFASLSSGYATGCRRPPTKPSTSVA